VLSSDEFSPHPTAPAHVFLTCFCFCCCFTCCCCQVSKTSFNRFGSKKPNDSSGWTDTPQQAAQRAAGLLPAAGPALHALMGPSAAAADGGEGAPVSAELLAAMAKYNQSHRQKSLLEQHAEQGQQGRKKEKGSKEKEKKEERKEKSKEKSSRKEKEQDSKKRKAAGGWMSAEVHVGAGWRMALMWFSGLLQLCSASKALSTFLVRLLPWKDLQQVVEPAINVSVAWLCQL
jgi:hypothetical protein